MKDNNSFLNWKLRSSCQFYWTCHHGPPIKASVTTKTGSRSLTETQRRLPKLEVSYDKLKDVTSSLTQNWKPAVESQGEHMTGGNFWFGSSVRMGFTWWMTLRRSLWDSLPCWWTAASVGAFSAGTGLDVTNIHHRFELIRRTRLVVYHSLLCLQPGLALHAALQLLVYKLSRLLGWFNPLLHL